MDQVLTERVVIVTGAGQGLGREHALACAAAGARIVVNDIGESANDVVDEIGAAGGTAVAHLGDVSDWEFARTLVTKTVKIFGTLDALVNNAGVNRDRMLVTMIEADWDFVVRVNLKGHVAPLHHAAHFWRERSKAGVPIAARVINTSSGAGLMGSVGQGNYGAAKAGVAVLTQIAAAELARYGVRANAIAPSARTQMTERAFGDRMATPADGFDVMHPANVSPLVVWLASEHCDVTGRLFEIEGGAVSIADGWRHGVPIDKGARWEVGELSGAVHQLIAAAPPSAPIYGA